MPSQSLSSSVSINEPQSFPEQEHVSAQQVDQLYAQAPVGIVASIVNGLIIAFFQWDVVSNRHIIIWLASLGIINFLGSILVYQYRTHHKTYPHPNVWGSWFLARSVVSGLIWGALAVFLYPHDSIPHQIFLTLILGGMVAGATAAHAASKEVFLSYSLPSVIPIIVRFFSEGDTFHVAMGMVGVLFLAMMIMTMRRNHEVLVNAIRLQFENSSLIAHLSDERDKAKTLNDALSEEISTCQKMERELVQHRNHLEQLVENRTSELRTSEARFQFLAENITDLIWMMTLDGKSFRYMSSAVERLLGYSLEETAKLSLEDVLTPSSLEKAQTAIQEEIINEQQGAVDPSRFRTLELEHRCKDGSIVWAEVRASFLRDEHGALIGLVGVTRDVTERKKIDKARRRLDTQLLRSQKMEAIGTLAGGIAHDFNNLLTGILGNISLAKDFLTENNPVFRFLRVAEHESIRAKGLTQQLLTFAKGGEPIKSLASLEVLVKNTVEFSLSGSAVAREYVYDEPLWLVELDAGQISQVVQSIVTNAVEAMPRDGQLIISWKNLIFDESSPERDIPLPPGCYVKISLADNGTGISSDHLPKIFDPYFTTKTDGHGLGLTTAYAITKKHNGHMTVESTVGHGTCVSLYFPASPESEKVVSRDPLVRKKGSGKILVMDDEESIRLLASEMLRSCGYLFEMAKNGEEAVTLYQEAQKGDQPFSAVLLDLTVPGGLGGKEAMAQLLQIDPNVKAVVTSGYSNDPIMAKYQMFGFQAVMTKPYTLMELSDVMYRIVMEPPEK